MRRSCGRVKWAGVLLALTLVVAGCADVFFQTPEFDNPHDPINAGTEGGSSASGTGELNYQGEPTALTQLWFHDYGPASPNTYSIDVIIGPAGVGESGTGSGRVVYLEMFFDTDSVSAGTYDWAADGSAGSLSNQSAIVTLINDEVTHWANLFGGTVTIAISGSTYTISGNVTTDTGDTAIFTYAGPLSGDVDYGADNQWEGTGSGVLNFGGSPYALSQHDVGYHGEQTAGVYNYDLHFWSSDSNYSIYLEMFFPSDTIGAGTYVYSTTGAAGTFSDFSDIVVDGSYYALIGGEVTITIAEPLYTVIGDVETTGGPATFLYEGALMAR